ncbi:DUF992 domain-containing protein [Breoghania sp.]|uniref:DUF992 domain-containing protein n=1 Tax=Breoghania sp. TaxID=2065378 RepID=UPI00262F264A|nr:DUF992 domain-containing protein [Breoghania sp.]
MSSGKAVLSALVCALALCVSQARAEDQPKEGQGQIKVGLLDCAIKSGGSTLLQSTKDLSCTFQRGEDGPADIYFGQIRRTDLDLGKTEGGVIRWFVFAHSSDIGAGALAGGDYVGVSAKATLGVGLNLAAGIAELELRTLD